MNKISTLFNRINNNFKENKHIFYICLFSIVTCMIYAPCAIYLTNLDEFKIGFAELLPILILVTGIVIVGEIVLYLITRQFQLERIWGGFIFIIVICIYIQYNFLNPSLPEFNGAEIDWSYYRINFIVSTLIWAGIFVAGIFLFCKYKDKALKIAGNISLFLSLVQVLSLIILAFTTNKPNQTFAFSKENEFSLGSNENIVVFVIDALEYDMVQEYLDSEDYVPGEFNDFTFYYHAISGGGTTVLGVPALLTGQEWEPMQSISDYAKQSWEDAELYDDLKREGYDIRLLVDNFETVSSAAKKVDNYEPTSYSINMRKKFIKGFYKLTAFTLAPQIIKPMCVPRIDDIYDSVGGSCYSVDDYQFCMDLLNNRISVGNYENAFRYYHLWGAHIPGKVDKNLNPIERHDYNTYDQMCADFKIIREYISQLKSLGLYDNTMIVITGDHGQHDIRTVQARPAILIKNMNEHHELIVDAAPISFKNVYSSLAANALDDYSKYGAAVNDINWDKNRDTLRYHSIEEQTVKTTEGAFEKNTPYEGERFFCIQHDDGGISYEEWNPYRINKVEYTLGEKIDFIRDSGAAKSVNTQINPTDEGIELADEFNLCLDLGDNISATNEYCTISMNVSNVQGKQQKMLTYVNGKRVDTHIFNNPESYEFTFPKDIIEDGKIIIRFVFPGANSDHQLDNSIDDWKIKSITISDVKVY